MTERAVALVYRPDDVVAGPGERLDRLGAAGGAGGPPRRLGRVNRARGYVALALAVLVGAWLVMVFGRSLGELNEATARAAEVRAETVAIEARLEALRREAELAQTDEFMAMQARAFGMGRAGELAFALEPGAPSPPPVVPLGSESREAGAATPLDAWLELLLGD